jgi:hypothetical protein
LVCGNRVAHYANIGAGLSDAARTSLLVNRAQVKLAAYFSRSRGVTMSVAAICRRGSALAAIVLASATSALAAEGAPSRAVSANEVFAARQSAVAAAQALQPAGARRHAVATSGGAAQPTEIFANPFRAYPPSCLGDGLPFQSFPQSQGDPAPQQQQMTLIGDLTQCLGGGNANECNYTEPVTVTVWRVACSNNQTAVLMEIDRTGTDPNRYPTFPLLAITQNNLTLYPVRAVDDPNTIYANTFANSPLYFSDIFVLENYASTSTQQIDYAKAFTLSLDNNTITFNFPDYDRTKYGAGNGPLPISGYLSTNWYNPLESGEGMLTQIYDDYNDTTGTKRTFTAAWYTFDPLGLPFWLYAQGSITIGDRAANNIQVFYASNGKFAGSGNATFTQWGTANFSFPDCDHMVFTYTGNADAVNGPTGSGTRTWSRLTNINSLVCN